MAVRYQEIYEYFNTNKDKIPLAFAGEANDVSAARDTYLKELDAFLKDQAATKEDLRQAVLLTLDGVKNLQTIAVAFIALVGSLIQFGFTRGLDWYDCTIVALAAAGITAALSLYCGFRAIGAVVDHVQSDSSKTAQPWQTTLTPWCNSPNWWKNAQSILGIVVLIAFGASIWWFPTTPRIAPQPVTTEQVVAMKAWKKLELVAGSLSVSIGPLEDEDGASIRVEGK